MPRSLYAQLRRRFGPAEVTSSRARAAFPTGDEGAATIAAVAPILPLAPLPGRRVIVVGGGLAGLACADALLAAGCVVTVFEARPRLGGRVISYRDVVPGKVVEGGAEFIGANHPAWLAYARRFNLNLVPADGGGDDLPVLIGNRRIGPTQQATLFAEMDTAVARITRLARIIDPDLPWLNKYARELDAISVKQWIDGLPVSPLAKRALAAELTADNGVRVARQSLLAMLTLIAGGGLDRFWTETEAFRCEGGASKLTYALSREVGGDHLRKNTPVSKVDLKADRVIVTTERGEVMEADDVVLAVPPGVWKKIAFSPPLPGKLHPQVGNVVKFLSAADTRAWKGGSAMTDGRIALTWESTAGQGESGPHGLTGFASAAAAKSLLERWNRGWTEADVVQELEAIHAGITPHVIKTRLMPWPNEKWTAGGYSFPAPGEITALGPILHRGIGRLHFAGEHCCYKFAGYMEGALESGLAVAKRLAAPSQERAASKLKSVSSRE